jgi:hypothetical protein
MAPKHVGRKAGWIIARTENDDLRAGDLPNQRFEIAVCRDQDEVASGGVVQDPAVADTGKPISNALSDSGNRSRNSRTSIGDRLSSKRSFILWRLGSPKPIRRISVYGEQVIRFELGIIGQDLLLGCATREPLQNLLNSDPVAANARLPEPHVSIDHDSLQE